MKSARVIVLLGVLFILAAAAGYKYWAGAEDREQERQRVERTVRSTLLAEDYAVPRAPNEQHEQLLKLVGQAKTQYIVFPPSAPKFRPGLDVTARIAIARQLAHRIEAETGEPVPDPAVVFEALDSPRRLDVEAVKGRLASAHAQWLISGSVWHDANGQMTVKLVKVPLKASSSGSAPTFERAGIAIGEETPPEAAFVPLAAEALHGLGFKGAVLAATKEDAPAELPLPLSPIDAEAAQKTITEGLWLQQLVGVLHDSSFYADPRPRERAFERTLAGLESLSSDSGDYAILMARSLLYTGRPLAANKLLRTAPATTEGKALLAYLSGDLPALKAAVPQIRRDIPRMIAECELTHLRYKFGVLDQNDYTDEAQRLASLVPSEWQPLFVVFTAHQHAWTMPEPSQLKPLLDHAFPVEGFGVQDLLRGKEALGASLEDRKTAMELIVSPLVHAAKWRAANGGRLCCSQGSGQWARYDPILYLDLLDGFAGAELPDRVVFVAETQGHQEEALRLADDIDSMLYHGLNPQLLGARLMVLGLTPKRELVPARHAQVRAEQIELAKKILSWDSAQSFASGRAVSVDSQAGARNGLDSSVFDFPRRPMWANQMGYGLRNPVLAETMYRDACRLSVDDLWYCDSYVERVRMKAGKQEYRKAIAELVEPRFAGSGSRARLLARLKEEDGDLVGAEKIYVDAIATGSHQQTIYQSLGYLQLRDGRYTQATETFLAYPELKRDPENTVGLSNYLTPAATALAMSGAMSESSQLFRIVAGYRDQSFANLSGVIQYAFLEGRYELARDVLREQYQHYHDVDSARRLASLLFMMGESENAWSVLNNAQTDEDPIYAALVGLRVSGADANGIASWAAARAEKAKSLANPLWLTFELLSEDRPAAALRQIYEVDANLRKQTKADTTREPPLQSGNGALLGKAGMPEPALIEGYAAIKERKYPDALSSMTPLFMEPRPRLGNGKIRWRPWQAFAYFGLAAAKTNGADRALELIEQVRLANENTEAAARQPIHPFYLNLSLAVAHAFQGDHAKAQAEIQKARSSINMVGGVLAPGYSFVEILERLYEETKHPAYMAIALEYAHAYQRYEPWRAWPYAFEARYAPAGAARLRAAAIALKLDPQSQWLHELDAQTMQQARQWAKANRWPAKDSPSQPAKWDQAWSRDSSRSKVSHTQDTILQRDSPAAS